MRKLQQNHCGKATPAVSRESGENHNGIIAVEILRVTCGKLSTCGDGVEKMNEINAVACGKLFSHFAGNPHPYKNMDVGAFPHTHPARDGATRVSAALMLRGSPLRSCATGELS
jgi:hypothetical protein